MGSALASIPGVALAKPPTGTCKELGFKCAANTECCSKNCIKNPQGNGKICGCPTGQTLCNNLNKCLGCTSPKVPNVTTCQCECPANEACTASGGTVDPNTCVCQCPAGKVLKTGGNECVQCNDPGQCPNPTDQCLKATCTNNVCASAPDVGKSCNDNNPCTENDTCTAAGACAGTQITGCVQCQSANGCPTQELTQCQQATCVGGVCGVENVPDGTSCDDLNPCTTNDVCAAGVCAGTLTEGCVRCQADPDCTSVPVDQCHRAVCGAGAFASSRTGPTARPATTATPAQKATCARPACAPAPRSEIASDARTTSIALA